MSTESSNWRNEVQHLLEQGQFAEAQLQLESCLKESSFPGSLDQLSSLIEICYTQSKHNKASEYADKLQENLDIKEIHWLKSVIVSYVICLFFLISYSLAIKLSKLIVKFLLPSLCKRLDWKHLNSLLFGFYWKNIWQCYKYSFLQLLNFRDNSQFILSVGLLGYTLSFSGHSLIGNKALRKAMKLCRRHGYDNEANQLSIHLGIGYCMANQSKHALDIYKDMNKTSDLPPFYSLLISANKVSLSLSDLGPLDAQNSINECFNHSFSLSNSHNHIQIYGGQAVLSALLGKADDAQSLIKRAYTSAVYCGSPLNYLFYYRLEALMWLMAEDAEQCLLSIQSARKNALIYGMPIWNIQELDRIESICLGRRSNNQIGKTFYTVRFLLKSMTTRNLGLIGKGLAIFLKNVISSSPTYWKESKCIDYFRYQYSIEHSTKSTDIGQLSLKIASSFINTFRSVSHTKMLDKEGFIDQIRQSLPVTDVIQGGESGPIIEYVRNKYGYENSVIVNETTDKIRIKCREQGYFICVSTPKLNLIDKELDKSIFVGILIPEVDIQSEELIEAFLRVMLSQYVFNRSLIILEEQKRFKVEKEATINQTIAKTVQMLAHDVRRPFSMVQGILDILATSDDPEDAQQFAIKHLPEVKRAIASVTSMLSDVIEVGTLGKLNVQSASPIALVESILMEHFRYNETADIEIEYDFQHTSKVMIDVTKMSRVLSNIVINALQAMSFFGKVWFRTKVVRDVDRNYVQFTIGNSGSYIPPEALAKLFEPYYTNGKKSGTGLGLAIADKIVKEHEGKIWCDSSESNGTEFIFTLPCSVEPEDFLGQLLKHSNEIYSHFQPQKERESEGQISIGHEEEIRTEKLVQDGLINSINSLSILITDDEPLYRSILKEQIASHPKIAEKISITLASSGEQTLRLAEEKRFDIIVLDVDFGPALINGFETTQLLRKNGNQSTIIIHSNRGALQYQSMSIDAGADLFIPKPMSRIVFLKIIASTIERLENPGHSNASTTSISR